MLVTAFGFWLLAFALAGPLTIEARQPSLKYESLIRGLLLSLMERRTFLASVITHNRLVSTAVHKNHAAIQLRAGRY